MYKKNIIIQEDIYTNTAVVHINNQVSEEILRYVRQEGPISTKLFAATIHEIFKNAQFEVKGMTEYGRKTVVPDI